MAISWHRPPPQEHAAGSYHQSAAPFDLRISFNHSYNLVNVVICYYAALGLLARVPWSVAQSFVYYLAVFHYAVILVAILYVIRLIAVKSTQSAQPLVERPSVQATSSATGVWTNAEAEVEFGGISEVVRKLSAFLRLSVVGRMALLACVQFILSTFGRLHLSKSRFCRFVSTFHNHVVASAVAVNSGWKGPFQTQVYIDCLREKKDTLLQEGIEKFEETTAGLTIAKLLNVKISNRWTAWKYATSLIAPEYREIALSITAWIIELALSWYVDNFTALHVDWIVAKAAAAEKNNTSFLYAFCKYARERNEQKSPKKRAPGEMVGPTTNNVVEQLRCHLLGPSLLESGIVWCIGDDKAFHFMAALLPSTGEEWRPILTAAADSLPDMEEDETAATDEIPSPAPSPSPPSTPSPKSRKSKIPVAITNTPKASTSKEEKSKGKASTEKAPKKDKPKKKKKRKSSRGHSTGAPSPTAKPAEAASQSPEPQLTLRERWIPSLSKLLQGVPTAGPERRTTAATLIYQSFEDPGALRIFVIQLILYALE